MNEQQIETAGLWATGVIVGVMLAFWVFVYAPQRDAMLFETHDCFVEQGCENMIRQDGHLNSDGRTCWNSCTERVSSKNF